MVRLQDIGASAVFLGSLLALSLSATTVRAQDLEGTWDLGVTFLDLSSYSAAGANGSSISVDDETGWGFSGAYYFTDRLALGFDLTYADPQYQVRLVPEGLGPTEVVSAELGVDVIHLKGIYNFIEDSSFTPYVEFGAGWTYLDSNIVEGISIPGCWWDPWWGYTCPTYFDTYTDTRTSISYGVGVRYQTDTDLIIKAAWGVHEIDTDRSEDIELDSIQLTIGWNF